MESAGDGASNMESVFRSWRRHENRCHAGVSPTLPNKRGPLVSGPKFWTWRSSIRCIHLQYIQYYMHVVRVLLPLLQFDTCRIFPYLLGLLSQGLHHGGNMRPISQSHNAPAPYPTIHHSEQKCTHFFNISVLNGVLWDMRQVHRGICEIGPLYYCRSYDQ